MYPDYRNDPKTDSLYYWRHNYGRSESRVESLKNY